MREDGQLAGQSIPLKQLLACFGKVAYASASMAQRAIRMKTRRPSWRGIKGRKLCNYHCKHCGQWHIGGSNR